MKSKDTRMKALVIGGNGFIGSHLVDQLVANGWEVVVLDFQERRYDSLPAGVHFIHGDLNQPYIVREALVGVDVVYHLAWATIHEVANQDPAADISANLIPTIHLIEACRSAGTRRFVFTSSGGTIYGPAAQFPTTESHPQNPINAYGITKLAVEKYLQMFNHLYGFDYAVLRPSVPYGPRQNPLGKQGAVAVFLYRVSRNLPINIWGDGSATRDYFYIGDLVAALRAAAECPLDRERIFNIGGSQGITLNGLLKKIENTVGKKAVVEYQQARKFDAPKIVLDTTLAKQLLNWEAKVSLDEGLENTWKWMTSAHGD
jgi:UDP-glucose 4-epimerase